MRLSDSRHPMWNVLRLAIVATAMVMLLTHNYDSGWDPRKDLGTILGTLMALGGFDAVKSSLTKYVPQHKPDPKPDNTVDIITKSIED